MKLLLLLLLLYFKQIYTKRDLKLKPRQVLEKKHIQNLFYCAIVSLKMFYMYNIF